MKQKGVYPYDYMNSFEKLNETQLPSQNDFYSQMNNQHITDEEYNHAQNVWNTFHLKTMGEYHNLYLQSDVLLLADVFEKFQENLSGILQIGSLSLFHITRIELGCNVEND